MAKHMNSLSVLCLLVCVLSVHAENINDPTKPPMTMLDQSKQATIADPNALVLQSIALGSEIKSAMINGETVLLGQRYQDWRLVQLSSNHAVLKNEHGETRRLDIYYPIQKMRVKPPAAHVAKQLQHMKSEHNHD